MVQVGWPRHGQDMPRTCQHTLLQVLLPGLILLAMKLIPKQVRGCARPSPVKACTGCEPPTTALSSCPMHGPSTALALYRSHIPSVPQCLPACTQVMEDARARAQTEPLRLSRNWVCAVFVFALWLGAIEWATWFSLQRYGACCGMALLHGEE